VGPAPRFTPGEPRAWRAQTQIPQGPRESQLDEAARPPAGPPHARRAQSAQPASPLDAQGARAHDDRGVALGEAGKLDEAVVEFERAIAIDPRYAAAHFHLGLAYDRLGRDADAVARYEDALRLKPDFTEARYGLSGVCLKIGDDDGAVALLRQVLATAPSFAEAHYNLGLALWHRGKSSRGEISRTVAAGDGDSRDAGASGTLSHDEDARDASKPGTTRRGVASRAPAASRAATADAASPADLDAAADELARAVETAPQEARFQSALGQLLAERQQVPAAIEHLERAVMLAARGADASPAQRAEYAYNLGLALRLHGDLDAAAARFREAVALDPHHALARRSLGLILRQQDDLGAAADELRRAVAERPDDAQGWHVLGTVLVKRGDGAGAIDAFRQATQRDPSLVEAHVMLAQALARDGRKGEALAEQAEIQRLNAEKADFGRTLVLLDAAAEQAARGRTSAAIAQLREAVALSPRFPEALYRLALMLRPPPPGSSRAAPRPSRSGAPPSTPTTAPAATSASAANATSPQAAGSDAGSAQTTTRTARDRNAREAESLFAQVVALDPDRARAHFELGRLLAARGDTAGAAQALRIATMKAPSLIEAREELARAATATGDWTTTASALKGILAWSPDDARATAIRTALATALDHLGASTDAAAERARVTTATRDVR
jgi:tetratricopeptide (TPR) repeat protein